jgi:hypothetical protein
MPASIPTNAVRFSIPAAGLGRSQAMLGVKLIGPADLRGKPAPPSAEHEQREAWGALATLLDRKLFKLAGTRASFGRGKAGIARSWQARQAGRGMPRRVVATCRMIVLTCYHNVGRG